MRVYKARCPGTFGELIQGRIGGRNFLVTCPINVYSEASFYPDREQRSGLDLTEGYHKVRAMIEVLAKIIGVSPFGRLQMSSSVPQGKGMASSSADIVSAGAAFLSAFPVKQQNIPGILAKAAGKVEPTDGVMYSGIVAYAQHESRLLFRMPECPFRVIGIIPDSHVDTVSYNSSRVPYDAEDERTFLQLVRKLRTGLEKSCFSTIASCTGHSAEINQRYLPNPYYKEMSNIARSLGGTGVIAAHSGTVIGLLLPPKLSHALRRRIVKSIQDGTGRDVVEYCSILTGVEISANRQLEGEKSEL